MERTGCGYAAGGWGRDLRHGDSGHESARGPLGLSLGARVLVGGVPSFGPWTVWAGQQHPLAATASQGASGADGLSQRGRQPGCSLSAELLGRRAGSPPLFERANPAQSDRQSGGDVKTGRRDHRTVSRTPPRRQRRAQARPDRVATSIGGAVAEPLRPVSGTLVPCWALPVASFSRSASRTTTCGNAGN